MLGIKGWMGKQRRGSALGFVVKLETQKQIRNESNMLQISNRARDKGAL